jgi:hypothetical protein
MDTVRGNTLGKGPNFFYILFEKEKTRERGRERGRERRELKR